MGWCVLHPNTLEGKGAKEWPVGTASSQLQSWWDTHRPGVPSRGGGRKEGSVDFCSQENKTVKLGGTTHVQKEAEEAAEIYRPVSCLLSVL